MKIQNHPTACGFLAGLLVLLLGTLVNGSCAHTPKLQMSALEEYDASLPRRTLVQQAAAAVVVASECGTGSGVLVTPTLVLTAHHVIECKNGLIAKGVTVRTTDKSVTAYVEIADPARDLARLKISVPTSVPPVHIRFAVTGEEVCAETATPERKRRCGAAGGFGGRRDYGDLDIDRMNTWFGNSGSGVYSRDGALVGIVTRLTWCGWIDALMYSIVGDRIDTCGGRSSSITGSLVTP